MDIISSGNGLRWYLSEINVSTIAQELTRPLESRVALALSVPSPLNLILADFYLLTPLSHYRLPSRPKERNEHEQKSWAMINVDFWGKICLYLGL